ncbi:MAG: CvpA family protein, partial [Streptococcaceae bacterium]|nr:CvpA family protein [Streptococcaceae bacterium]
MLAIILIIIFAYAYYAGYRRGFALQMLYTIGYLVSYAIASLYYRPLGEKLYLWIPYPNPTAETNMLFFDRATSFILSNAFYAGVA